jgi:hypothetical protein
MAETNEALTQAVGEVVQKEVDLRERVRNLTLDALRQGHLDGKEIRAVVKSVLDGVNLGLDRRAADVRQAAREAVGGLDEALGQAANALALAVKQAVSEGSEYTNQDLKGQWENIKQLESGFLTALKDTAAAARDKAKVELGDLFTHLSRSGTDTGRRVKETLETVGNRVEAVLAEGRHAAGSSAREAGSRIAAAASGFLAGVAEVLQEKSQTQKK